MLNQEKIRQLAGIGYVNAATMVWASNMVIGRMVRDDIGPLALSAARFSIAALIFALVLRKKSQLHPNRKALGTIAGMALLYAMKANLVSYGIAVQPTIDFLTTYVGFVLLGMILVGDLVGTVSSLLATRRYLKI